MPTTHFRARLAAQMLSAAAATVLLSTSAQAATVSYDFSGSDTGGNSYSMYFELDFFIPMPASDSQADLLAMGLPNFSCTVGGAACDTANLKFTLTDPLGQTQYDNAYTLSLGSSAGFQNWYLVYDNPGVDVLGAVGTYAAVGECDDCRGSLNVSQAGQPPAAVPEPAAWGTLALALGVAGWSTRRRAAAAKR
jgi:hypothetical protein